MTDLFQIGLLDPVSVMLHVVDKRGEHKLFMVNTGPITDSVETYLIFIVSISSVVSRDIL